MKTIKEFFPNHTLKDKHDLELPQFTAEDIEAYTIHILRYLAEDCEEMGVKEKYPFGRGFRTVYAVSKETIIDKINNIW